MTDAYTWVALALNPITGVVTWFASRHTRRNDTIKQMQETIDMLVAKNTELVEEMTKLRAETASLKEQVMSLNSLKDTLLKENAMLRSKVASKSRNKKVER